MKKLFTLSALSLCLLTACGGGSETSDNANSGGTTTPAPTPSPTPAPTPTPAANTAPVANAGSNQSVNVGQQVTLSGAQSSDADGDSLTYQWTLSNQPNGSQAVLTAQVDSASFTPDVAGDYTISLVVNDGTANSSVATVTVTAAAVTTSNDITDRIFTNRSGNCEDYLGSYISNVTDIKRAIDFSGDISVTSNATKCLVASNEIPNHDFNDNSAAFANDVATQVLDYQFPKSPSFAASVTNLSLPTTEGVLLNGVTIDILAAACYAVGNDPLGREKIGCGNNQIDNPWRYDPMSPLNTFGTDIHNAHTQDGGRYHYHGNPNALFESTCGSSPSGVIGFAADGFPIYGSCITDPNTGNIRKARSSYALRNNGGARQDVAGYTTPVGGVGVVASNNYDGQFRGDYEYVANSGDLDECNGMTVDGQYGYYIVDQFPWAVACFKGSIDSSFSNKVEQARRSHSHGGVEHTH